MKTSYPSYICEFNFIRFVAALSVVLFHLNTFVAINVADSYIKKGFLAVDLFFILSGFVMCRVYLEKISNGSFSLADFLIRRIARLYPLHVVLILMFGIAAITCNVIGLKLNQTFPVYDLPAHLALVHGWG